MIVNFTRAAILFILLSMFLIASDNKNITEKVAETNILHVVNRPAITTTDNSLPQDVTSKMYKEIAQREYHISYDSVANRWQSPNRANNLRAEYAPGLWKLQNRRDSAGHNWKMSLATEGVYANGNLLQKVPAGTTPVMVANTIRFAGAAYTEEYVNTPEGVRQNFIIQEAPQGTNQIVVKLKATGISVKQQNDSSLQFIGKIAKLTYTGLKAWDATGKPVVATLKAENNIVVLTAEAAGATYPLTIDPIVSSGTPTNANTLLESNQENANLGYSVAGAGDINGDGYSDVIVGAPLYDNGSVANAGAAFVYQGSASGIGATATFSRFGTQAGMQLGFSVAGAGDLNGDGYSDVVVGAPLYDGPSSRTDVGAFLVYRGTSLGVSTAGITIVGALSAGQLGFSVADAGDVNGDGYSDIIAGSPYAFNIQGTLSGAGAVSIYQGSASVTINSSPTDGIRGTQAESYMGYCVAGAGDINGDGYSDIVAGAYGYNTGGLANAGALYVRYGSASGIGGGSAPTITGTQAGMQLGFSVSKAGDINGDGYGDILAGANLYDDGRTDEGGVFVYSGTSTGISTTVGIVLESNFTNNRMGSSVACAGDVNGDGYSDIIAGAVGYSDGQSFEGAALLYQGSATGLSQAADATIQSNYANAQLGFSVSGIGDINGDGYSDVIAGAPYYYNGEPGEGAAFTYHGSASGISTTPAAAVEKDQAYASLGYSVAGAGDVNGDGYSDVIVGAPYYDNGQTNEGAAFVYHGSASGISTAVAAMVESNQTNALLGLSVAGAGDVNGDGYSDVGIGASSYDNGQTDEGAAFIYHGSASGISTTAAAMVESNYTNAELGSSVAGAGDVNGDGYSDVIVGAPSYSSGQTNEGAAFIYHGSALGISTTAATTIESNLAGAFLGVSVAGAGDVNGDGYSDVIVGAPYYNNGQTNEGAAFVYHGSASGIITAAATTMESNQAGASLGISVAGAGDVNGDGYSDVIAGALYYNNGQTNEGAVFIYHGSASGINTTVATTIESNLADAFLGVSVAGAGDVNGDGYSDVIVGAPFYINEGTAFIYHGSASGISTTVAAEVGSNQGGKLGRSVACAGDVNGDGYSDVIVGAPDYNNGQTNEGSAFVYQGNAGGGRRSNLHLFNTTVSTVFSRSNVNSSTFAIGLFAKSPVRGKVRLVWETVSASRQVQPYSSGSSITNSVQYTSRQAAYSTPATGGSQLTSTVDKVNFVTGVRARLQYDPVTSVNGQVYGPWVYLQNPAQTSPQPRYPAILLPVQLLNFTAIAVQNKQVQASWQTATEINSSHFIVERSKDGLRWETVTTLKAAGNSTQLLSYTATDAKPYGGLSYYRLQQVDKDGKQSYSSISTVFIKTAGIHLQAYPNPAKNALVLEGSEEDLRQIQIFDALGRDVTGSVRIQQQSNNRVGLNISGLVAGVYYLKTTTATMQVQKE